MADSDDMGHYILVSVRRMDAEAELRNSLRAEIAALKAERDRLRARKVKLPIASAECSGYEGDEYQAYASGLVSMKEQCAEAIRAAGVEVGEP